MLQFTTTTFIWFIGCLMLGLGYAWFLYRSSANLSVNLRRILFASRTLIVAILSFLLIAPLVKSISTSLDKPIIIIAQDKSASIRIARPRNFSPAAYSQQYKDLEKQLSQDYEIRSFSFGEAITEGLNFNYNAKLTNITALFRQVTDKFANRNIGAIIMATDGIYNSGGNPQYEIQSIKAPVYTIALGDTVPKKDLIISNVNYNNIAYLGNEFQIEVSLEAFLSKGVNTVVSVSDKSGLLYSKPVSIRSDEYRKSISFSLPAKAKGIQKYTISVSPVPGELSRQNNSQTIYVEVVDGRKKILLIANAPHPDISALKQIIEINKNYELQVVLGTEVQQPDINETGLVILHQLPSSTNNAQALIKQLEAKPQFFILGSQTSTEVFSENQSVLGITSSGATQEAIANVRKDFYGFTLSAQTTNRLGNFAPLLSPFGNYVLKGNSSVLLGQQIGKVSTAMPLLVFGENGSNKIGILAGEGIWRWRLEEFQENGNHDAVNELISKSIQYLSSTDDKRKFRAYAAKNAFDENERVILNAELYNDAYELVNTPDVRVNLKNQRGKGYSYIFSKTGNAYVLDAGILPAGEYQFAAATELGNKKHAAGGRFIISGQSPELRQTTANHQLLYSLANQSGGKMIFPNQLNQLPGLIKANENIKTISYANRRYEEIIDLKLIFFLLLGLLSAEWFLRKRNGEI
ncbi:MAG TPA: hypothetical protein VNI52_13170 [Sphingobacteriaceae bacterium]|nr:hypothetical protein [Sphingobacteriaceae bacterium]